MAIQNSGMSVALRPGRPIRGALLELWTGLIDGAVELNGIQGADEATVVHQLRVTIKRLRAMLQWVRPVVEKGDRGELNGQLRELSHLLAEARRAAVFQQLLSGEEAPEPVDAGGLRTEFIEKLKAHRDDLARLLPPKIGWSKLSKGVCEAYSRARLRLERWRESGDPRLAHDCRKSVKHLKYAIEFLMPLDPGQLGEFHRRIDTLEDQLGDLNDLLELSEVTSDRRAKRRRASVAKRALQRAERVLRWTTSGFAKRLDAAREAWS